MRPEKEKQSGSLLTGLFFLFGAYGALPGEKLLLRSGFELQG